MLLLTRAVLLCSLRANAKKASRSLALWHCAHAFPSCSVSACSSSSESFPYCPLPSLLRAPLVWGFRVPVHFSSGALRYNMTSFYSFPCLMSRWSCQHSYVPQGIGAETRPRCGACFAHQLDSNHREHYLALKFRAVVLHVWKRPELSTSTLHTPWLVPHSMGLHAHSVSSSHGSPMEQSHF